jgi:hypothetical protein
MSILGHSSRGGEGVVAGVRTALRSRESYAGTPASDRSFSVTMAAHGRLQITNLRYTEAGQTGKSANPQTRMSTLHRGHPVGAGLRCGRQNVCVPCKDAQYMSCARCGSGRKTHCHGRRISGMLRGLAAVKPRNPDRHWIILFQHQEEPVAWSCPSAIGWHLCGRTGHSSCFSVAGLF